MGINQLNTAQNEIHNLLIDLLKTLGCTYEIHNTDQGYKIRCGEKGSGPICLYIEFKGGNTTAYPKYSIHAFAARKACLEDDRFLKKNSAYGPSIDVITRPEIPVEVTLLFEFICRAIWCCKMQMA